ncbi:HAD family hydrolase [Dactylosporangium darangshiense]|uniref:Cof-type HAD-IIB family hydrolase n=1 Tax=Dactylosporangium darangshiense TaxID=579108 RepID=A0ABP8D450_9ACTN
MTGVSAVVTDLDGTVVRRDGTVSEATLRAAALLFELGIPLVAATARTPAGLRALEPLRPLLSLSVCCGGAIGVGPDGETTAWREDLPPAAIEALAAVALARWPQIGVATYDGGRWRMTERYLATRHTRHFGPTEVCDLDAVLATPACAMALVHPRLEAVDLMAGLAGAAGVSLTRASAQAVEVTAAGVDKASGVRRALLELGAAPERAIAFGDMPIDVAMFGVVGRSVAMADAPPEVLAAATDRTSSVEQDGFAAFLSRTGLIGPFL